MPIVKLDWISGKDNCLRNKETHKEHRGKNPAFEQDF